MKIKVDVPILSYDGNPLLEIVDGKKQEITWKDIIFTALNSQSREEVLTGEQKAKCYSICNNVYSNKEPDLTLDERGFIVERIDKVISSPLVCGRAKEFFDNRNTK